MSDGHDKSYWNSPQHANDVRDSMYEDKKKREAFDAVKTELDERHTQITKLLVALQLVLDSVDYLSGACRPNDMVAAVLPKEIINIAREAMKKEAIK